MKYSIVAFEQHGDERGTLIALESKRDGIPFDIKRVYYMYGTKDGVRRGFHAHKTLKQVLICVSGSCKIHLDNGRGETAEIPLDDPSKGLLLTETGIWREMYDFSPDAVLMVLASDYYNESDYIRDYNMFLKYVNNGGNKR